MIRRHILTLLVLVIAFSISTSAFAQTSWAVAERKDDQISALVTKLDPYVETLPGLDGAAGVILYHQVQLAPEKNKTRICRNLVIRVNDPAGIPDTLLRPWNDYGGKIEGTFGFVRRGDDYRRLGEAEMPYVEGLEDIGRDRFDFQWGELASGDLVGWSVVVELKSPPMAVSIGLAEELPMVIANLNVRSKEKFGYAIRTNGVGNDEVKIKEQELVDKHPMVLKVSANQRVAIADVPTEEPYPSDYPHVSAVLEDIYVDSDNPMVQPGWASRQGWNTLVTMMSGLVEGTAEDTKDLSIPLAAVTTGAKTDLEKAAAICGWVRDKFELLDGPEIQRQGMRPMNDVYKAKKATEFEKILLMTTALSQLDVECTIGLLRRPELGELDHDWRMMDQFSDAVVRVEGPNGPTFWAPQCTDCEPGAMPANYVGAEVLVHDTTLSTVAEEFQAGLMKQAQLDGKFNLAKIQEEIEAQTWHRFEVIGE